MLTLFFDCASLDFGDEDGAGEMLHVVDVDRVYCGPTAIASITNAPIPLVYKKIRRVRGDNERRWRGKILKGGAVLDSRGRKIPIKSLGSSILLLTMKRFGFKFKEIPGGGTLREFCEDRGHLGPFIVMVSGHYVAVSRGYICDTYTSGKPVPWTEYSGLGRHVRQAWLFSGKPLTAIDVLAYVASEKPKKEKPKVSLVATRAVRIAAQIDAWERKKRRAENALKKLARKAKYYEAAIAKQT